MDSPRNSQAAAGTGWRLEINGQIPTNTRPEIAQRSALMSDLYNPLQLLLETPL